MAYTIRIALLWHRYETGKPAADPKFDATVVSIFHARRLFAKYGFKLDFLPQHYGKPVIDFPGKIDFQQAGYQEKYADRVSDKFPPIPQRDTRLPVVFARSCFEEEVAKFELNEVTEPVSGICCRHTQKGRLPYVMVSDEGFGPDILTHEIGHAAKLDHIAEGEGEWSDILNLMNTRTKERGMRTNFSPRQVEALKQAYFCIRD